MVEQLLARGADPLRRETQFHSTPLGWAAEAKQRAIMDRLVRHAPPDYADALEFGYLEQVRAHLRRDGALANAPGAGGAPGAPLRGAAAVGNDDLAQLLLEFGADPTLRDEKGRSPLDPRPRGEPPEARRAAHARTPDRIRWGLGRQRSRFRPMAASDPRRRS